MNNKHPRQRFINGGLVFLSVTSLALFGLQLWTSALGSPGCMMVDADTDSRLVGGGFYWWTTAVQAFLLLTLVLVALGTLFNLRSSRRSEEVRRCLVARDTGLMPAGVRVAS